MKIMIVTPYYAPAVGGLENYARNIAKGLVAEGHDVFVVTANHLDKSRREDIVDGIRVIRLPIQIKFSNTPISVLWPRELRKIIRVEQPAIVNAHAPVPGLADFAIAAAKSLGIPRILTYHAATLKKKGSILFTIIEFIYRTQLRKTMRKATRIIAVSDFVKQSLPIAFQLKTDVVYNGIDLDSIPSLSKKRLKNQFIFIGSLKSTHAWKGLSETLEAISYARQAIPTIKLLILGDGDMIEQYRKLATTLNIEKNVSFLGNIDGEEKYKLLASSSALIAYPTTENDAFPTVFPEAWATKTPIIGAKIGALTSLLDNNFGTIVPPRSPEELSKILLNPAIYQSTDTQSAFSWTKNHLTWSSITHATLEVYNSSRQPKVFLLHNIISPYRLPVFESLSKQVQLAVVFCKTITKDREWSTSLSSYSFPRHVMPGRSFGPLIINRGTFSLIRDLSPDYVIANNDPDVASAALPAVIFTKLYRRRFILWSQSTDDEVHFISEADHTPTPLKLLYPVIKYSILIYRRLLMRAACSYITIGDAARQYLLKRGIKKTQIFSCINIMPAPLLPTPTHTYKRNGKRTLYIGYLLYRKGVQYLIRAFIQVEDPKATLTIVGTGSDEKRLKKMAAKDSRITFLPYADGVEKANLYAEHDIVVLPTLHDVWGLVVNEAIYYGNAIICSKEAGASEIISHQVGQVINSKNTSDLKNALLRYLDNPQQLKNVQSYNSSISPQVSDQTIFANIIYKAITHDSKNNY